MSREWMDDPYAAQLRAAKAEGELARIKDELREFAEDNGLNPEMEPRDLLAKAAGSFRSCAAMSDARYEEIERLKAEMEAMRPRLMPEGYEWPRFEDGELLKYGDAYIGNDDEEHEAWHIEFDSDGDALVLQSECCGSLKRVIDVFFKGERVKRPAVLAADGEPLEVGQTVWTLDDPSFECGVIGFGNGMVHLKSGADHLLQREPSDLTHQRPVLDADGVPIKKGDTVYGTVGGGPFIVTEVSDKESVFVDAFPDTGMNGSMFTHTKPEPTDTWGLIWASVTTGTTTLREFVRRCKALAERERGQ